LPILAYIKPFGTNLFSAENRLPLREHVMNYHHRSAAVLAIFLAILIIAPQGAILADDDVKDSYIFPTQLEKEIGPEIVKALRTEQKRRKNEAVLVLPSANGGSSILATFGNITALTRPYEAILPLYLYLETIDLFKLLI
jgi:hypothetical protein